MHKEGTETDAQLVSEGERPGKEPSVCMEM